MLDRTGAKIMIAIPRCENTTTTRGMGSNPVGATVAHRSGPSREITR